MASMKACSGSAPQSGAVPAAPGPSHNLKRAAPDDLETEQRLAKRLDFLKLDHHGKLYIPVAPESQKEQQHQPSTQSRSVPRTANSPQELNHDMQVEDTAHKIYIYDLNKELADVESDEETPIFLPDIEKRLNKIPQHILQDDSYLKPTAQNQLVLYNVPSSLTVLEEHDNVKKVITEARARVNERQALSPGESVDNGGLKLRDISNLFTYTSTVRARLSSPDAMDIEEEL